nr:MAG TPA: hypothetical protein [Bacteriophage sp.]
MTIQFVSFTKIASYVLSKSLFSSILLSSIFALC